MSSRVVEVLEAARQRPQAERPAFLERECAGDGALFQLVMSQLETEAAPARPGVEHPEIGGFRIVRRIGTGGMGVVYEAVQHQPRRTVALKIMRPNLALPALASRFSTEAETLARLNHPAIASLYGMGVHRQPDGTDLPYFAMEFIAGAKPITAYASAKTLDLPARLGLFLTICEAVHYAHMRGVIHRDLKPENILVDVAGWPRVIDFGVVKLTNTDVHTTLATAAGEILGTLQYMSPEQCDGDPHVIDLRSDIYSLGVILYELVCRRTPYDVSGKRLTDAITVIRTQEPVPPGRINAGLAGDLEAIILKAMDRDPDRRYQSAYGFALDLRRYLGGEPIQARAHSATYTLRKVLWRWRREALVAFFGAVAVLFAIAWLVKYFELMGAAVFAGAMLLAAGVAAFSMRAWASGLQRARAELAEARRELGAAQAACRAREAECRALRERLDTTRIRVAQAVTDLTGDAQRLGVWREIKDCVDRAVGRLLIAADKSGRGDDA